MREEFQPDDVQDFEAPASATELPATTASEDLVLAQLKTHGLTAEAIEEIAQNSGVMKSRKVRMAVASHPKTPRRLALRVVRELYTFELMQFALTPLVAADLRHVADELLLSRLSSITLGERISLARRSSERVAGGLLLDKETPVWQAALENPRLTEAAVVRALQRGAAMPAFVEAVSHDARWSVRNEIRLALLRNAHTPFARAIEFARRLQPAQLRDILHTSRLPEKLKQYLRKSIEAGPKARGFRGGE
jgi:hypothetical protein